MLWKSICSKTFFFVCWQDFSVFQCALPTIKQLCGTSATLAKVTGCFFPLHKYQNSCLCHKWSTFCAFMLYTTVEAAVFYSLRAPLLIFFRSLVVEKKMPQVFAFSCFVGFFSISVLCDMLIFIVFLFFTICFWRSSSLKLCCFIAWNVFSLSYNFSLLAKLLELQYNKGMKPGLYMCVYIFACIIYSPPFFFNRCEGVPVFAASESLFLCILKGFKITVEHAK